MYILPFIADSRIAYLVGGEMVVLSISSISQLHIGANCSPNALKFSLYCRHKHTPWQTPETGEAQSLRRKLLH